MLQPRVAMGEPSSIDSTSNDCLICDKIGSSSELSSELGDIIKVTRGISSLKAASAERGDGLSQYINTRDFVYVHSVCRQKYINKGCINSYLKKRTPHLHALHLKKSFEQLLQLILIGKLGASFVKKKRMK